MTSEELEYSAGITFMVLFIIHHSFKEQREDSGKIILCTMEKSHETL